MNSFSDLIEAYIREKQEGKKLDFCAASWLDSASKRASQISIATHVLKYTHSEAKGTNIYVKSREIQDDHLSIYVSTDSLNKAKDDVVGNAAVMDVAGLLQIEFNGVTFLDLIARNDSSLLAPFADSETRLLLWMKGFQSILFDRKLSSDTLAKQIFFPVKNSDYHLLAPLYASSLSQAFYDRINENRFGEKAKDARERKKNGEYSDVIIYDYPDLAIQKFGGTKPQNISRLNSLRGGRSYLLRSAPPVWKSVKKPPIKKNDFWKGYEREVIQIIKEFNRYLITIHNLNSNKNIRNKIQAYVDQLLDGLLLSAAGVQVMEPGWSKISEISLNEQLWLDPLREDLKEMRCTETWKEGISSHFATMIIQKIKDENLKFSEMNHDYLSESCLEVLKWIEQ